MCKLLLTAAICLIGLPVLVAQEENPFKTPAKMDSENPFAQPEKREGDGERESEREDESGREGEREGDRERDVPRENDRERETKRDGERESERTISQEQLRELIGYLEKLRRENAALRQELARLRQRIDDVDLPRPDAPREGDRPRPDAPHEGERGQPAELEGLFKRYDKNSDKTVVLEEFLALHQGNLTEQARRFWQEFFVSQDRNNDEKWDFEEFVGAVRAYNQR